MKTLFFACITVGSLLAFQGCGDDHQDTGGNSPGTSSASTSTGSTSTSSSSASTSTSTSTSSASTSGSSSSGGMSSIVPTITAATVSANCMPIVPPDPIFASFDVDYDNTGSASGTLTITEATLEFTGIDAALVVTFEATPPDSGTVGAMQTVMAVHNKVADSGMHNDEPACGYCGAPGTLTVTWSDGNGGTAMDTFPIDTLECAF